MQNNERSIYKKEMLSIHKRNKKNLHQTFRLTLLDHRQKQQSSLINKKKKRKKTVKKLQIGFSFLEKMKINSKINEQYKFQEDYFI
jgi:hypothetical protein